MSSTPTREAVRQSTALNEDQATHSELADNFAIIQYVRNGFTTPAIARALGLTNSQVQSRVALYGLQGERAKFRNGEGEIAQGLFKKCLRVPKMKKDFILIERDRIREERLKKLAQIRAEKSGKKS